MQYAWRRVKYAPSPFPKRVLDMAFVIRPLVNRTCLVSQAIVIINYLPVFLEQLFCQEQYLQTASYLETRTARSSILFRFLRD
jgi:hypothetical protein